MQRDIGQIESSGIVLEAPTDHSNEGLPIGNGRMGTLVWTTPSSLNFQINRVDVFAVNRNASGEHFSAAGATTDYCGTCAQLRIDCGNEPFRPGPDFRQALSLHSARCTVDGRGVRAECWVAAEDDVLVVTITDDRETPLPIDLSLMLWREPEVRSGAHLATLSLSHSEDRIGVVQTLAEADHYCSSAVVVACPEADVQVFDTGDGSRVLRLSPLRGTRTILVASAASQVEDTEASVDRILTAFSTPDMLSTLAERHARWWCDFWARTHVDISSPDGCGERVAGDRLLFLYHMASSSRGPYPPKWNGSIFATAGDDRAWGSQFWLWTTEMLYWPLHAADAGDLAEPFFSLYRNAIPALETAARQRWDAEGIFVPETMPFDGPTELPASLVEAYRERFLYNPRSAEVSAQLAAFSRYDWHLEASTSRGERTPDGYSWISHLASSGAELAVHAWWRYRCSGDREWLRRCAYPLLRGVAEFYRTLCRRGEDGRWHVHGTNAHEDFWGVSDGIMDLAAIRGTVPLAICAAERLEVDAALCVTWREFLCELAPYPMGDDPRARALTGGALADDAWAAGYLGAVDGSKNSEDVQLTPIFPFEDWTLETKEPSLDAVARRTLELAPRHRRVLRGEELNTAIRSPIAAVRAGAAEDLPAMLEHYRAALKPQPNGFSFFEGVTAQSIEHLGLLTMMVQEALLQSVAPHPGESEIIRVFPAWPPTWDVSFRLLARGGFVVAATMRDGCVTEVQIESRFGEECRLRNPWTTACRVEDEDGEVGAHAAATEVVVFDTRSGGRYWLHG